MASETYLLSEEAWQQVHAARPHFLALFALTDRGVAATDPEYLHTQAQILTALGIPTEHLNSISALARICPAARFARGILNAEWREDLGSYLLTPTPRH
jgi:hypothetical protein